MPECFIEAYYGVDHSEVEEKYRNTFAIVGNLFGKGQPICAWCVGRLSVLADSYGDMNSRDMRGAAINVDAKVPLDVLIARSPLREVFEDIDLYELKYTLDHHLTEVNPMPVTRPNIEQEIKRIQGIRTVR